MAEGLSRKKKMRGGYRASTQRIICQVYETIESTEGVEAVCNKLEQYKVVLKEKLDTIKQLDADILDLVEENDLEEEIGLADEFKEKVRKAMFDSTKTIEAKQAVRVTVAAPHTNEISGDRTTPIVDTGRPPREVTDDTTGVTHTDDSTRDHTYRVKLPKLTPRKFNGELTRWLTFWDSFESSIHNNRELSDADKFNYLYTLLEGPALEAISGLKLTAANYSEAIAVLRK